jgi:ATP-dependent Clp protease ATP-binding subunit ClpC
MSDKSGDSRAPDFGRFTDRARRIVVLAQEEARMLNHDHIGTEHILLGLIHERDGVAAKALESLGISLDAVRQQVEEIIGRGQRTLSGHIPFTQRAKKVLQLSERASVQLDHHYIGTEHILLGLIRDSSAGGSGVEGVGVAGQVLDNLGVTNLDLIRAQVIRFIYGNSGEQQVATSNDSAAPVLSVPPVVNLDPSPSSALDHSGRNLTRAARHGRPDPVVGREREIERVMQVLSRHAVSSPVLVGAPGIGKTAIVHGLAARIAQGDVPLAFAGKKLFAVDPSEVARTAATQEDFDRRVTQILAESPGHGDVIVFFDDLRQGAGERFYFWSLLRSVLVRREAQIIGATTLEAYERLPGIGRALVPVPVTEPTVSHTVEILKSLCDRFATHHRISITEGALALTARLVAERLPDRRLPVKAIDLLDESASLAAMRGLPELDEALITETAATMLGVATDAATAPPLFPPEPMTEDDREIWAMS